MAPGKFDHLAVAIAEIQSNGDFFLVIETLDHWRNVILAVAMEHIPRLSYQIILC